MIRLTITLLAALIPVNAGQLSGTWTGSITQRQDDGAPADRSGAYLQLEQEGSKITGSVGPSSSNAHVIENASFSGDELKFSTHYADPESKETVTWAFDLRVNGSSMNGTGTGSRSGHSWTVEVTLERQKTLAQAVKSTVSCRLSAVYVAVENHCCQD